MRGGEDSRRESRVTSSTPLMEMLSGRGDVEVEVQTCP